MNANPIHKPNHLAGETSPYLKQHMNNPVDWYPWGEDALKKAIDENKPIFLSIGYSSCHWCHVMAHESFENEEIAKYLNKNFISIKLDREERPDLDQIYQHVIQMMGRRGGWPLSIFMTPDKRPFFAGTYFPNERKHGMQTFPEVLEKIVELYSNRRYDLEHTGNQIMDGLRTLSSKKPTIREDGITKDMLDLAMVNLEPSFDSKYGGFGGTPKFPNFPTLLFIIRQILQFECSNSDKYTNIKKELENTLDRMAAGGIYDHVGGGFARYSVDQQWEIPHFEKMLYDNALALQVYSEAYYLFQKPRYKEIISEIVGWILRDMYKEKMGFFSALDADSEGEEGKYYVWTKAELECLMSSDEQELFFKAYGVSEKGNFESSTNHLHVVDEKLVEKHRSDFNKLLEQLRSIREQRIPPSLDSKILTSWSSLMITGLYSAFRILNDPNIKQVAHDVMESLLIKMFSPVESILYRVLDPETDTRKIRGHLDDYAYLIQALFADFQYYPNKQTFLLITKLMEITRSQFWDTEQKGYFYSSSLNADTLSRLKTGSDMPLPNSNAVMVENLLQYHFYIGDPSDLSYLKQAEQTLELYIEDAYSHPTGFGALLVAVHWYLFGSTDIVIMDENISESEILAQIHLFYTPRLHLWYKTKIIPELKAFSQKFDLSSKYTLYFCENFNCLPPTTDWDEFLNYLRQNLVSI